MQPVPSTRETRRVPETKPTGTEPTAREGGGLSVFLWLLTALVVEVEFLVWLFSRAYT